MKKRRRKEEGEGKKTLAGACILPSRIFSRIPRGGFRGFVVIHSHPSPVHYLNKQGGGGRGGQIGWLSFSSSSSSSSDGAASSDEQLSPSPPRGREVTGLRQDF